MNPIILEIVCRWVSFFWFISSLSRTRAGAVWSLGDKRATNHHHRQWLQLPNSKTSNSSSSGSKLFEICLDLNRHSFGRIKLFKKKKSKWVAWIQQLRILKRNLQTAKCKSKPTRDANNKESTNWNRTITLIQRRRCLESVPLEECSKLTITTIQTILSQLRCLTNKSLKIILIASWRRLQFSTNLTIPTL